MAAVNDRPLSPHLTIWRWGPHMLVSILHRITGAGLTVIGLPVLVWWLLSVSEGADAHARFTAVATHWAGLVVLVGLTWAFFQKTFAGIRHLVMDSGMGFELNTNKTAAILTIVAAIICTAAIWAYFLGAGQ
ncbi:MAG: succinate dehydrogenase, cytochrome b556 subunit [Sphingomonas sp.]|nr:succinate dehydrogenase, cytochrome b556 subunit [Sphingomonas sp.]